MFGIRLYALALLMALLVVGCGGDDSDPVGQEDSSAQVDSDVIESAPDSLSSVEESDAGRNLAPDIQTESDIQEEGAEDSASAGSDGDESESDTSLQLDGEQEASDSAIEVEDGVQPTDALTQTDTSSADDTLSGEDTSLGPNEDANECALPCDCMQQGADCIEGQCVLGVKPVFCCELEGCIEGEACVSEAGLNGLCGVQTSSAFGVLIINEVLTDGAVDGDPNGDGDSPDSVGDEFVELVNSGSSELDISAFQLFESNMPFVARHVFPAGTLLPAGKAMVVFGGGSAPDDTESAQFVVANANDPGIPLGLALNNEGDVLTLLDEEGHHVATFAYGPGSELEAITDESFNRQPDISGEFIGHTWAAGSPELLFSPGTKADGTSF